MLGELNTDQIEVLLREQIIGRIGTHDDGQTYIVPITYAYDGNYIYGHTHEGMKVHMMRKNPQVCFEVDSVENFANWRSVIVWGKFEELSGNEANEAMLFFGNRLRPFMVSQTAEPHLGISEIHKGHSLSAKDIVFRIKLERKTGRFERR